LFIQQAVALFVLKSGAGFSIFKWIATLASDFLDQALAGAAFFFSDTVTGYHWFFVNTVSAQKLIHIHLEFSSLCEAVSNHILYCLCADDVLPRRHAVDH
jgi:nucleoside permease NupC